MGESFEHHPVMAREVVEHLAPVPAGTIVDCTVGGAGHATQLLTARTDLRLLGIDRDPTAVAAAREALAPFGERARVVHAGFGDLTETVRNTSEGDIVGILFDLGVSSPQLDRRARGFSYWDEAPLDMRMDSSQSLTAADVVNTYGEAELTTIISAYGEERFASRIAREIVARRPLHSTGDLVEAVKAAIPAPARRTGGHPARRTFQAIRMEVNQELQQLEAGLDESVHLLAPRGRVLVLAYHSLEDRAVKQRFHRWAGRVPAIGRPDLPVPAVEEPLVRLVTRKPQRPTEAEVADNPRASSALLRVAERLA
ncbi:MAG: 16S rRNA (cytosine(1402)-N(4))-methyltransferase RsmH [Actinomycetes bacterium]